MQLTGMLRGLAAALAVFALATAAEAHRPPPGQALEHRAARAGHTVEIMVVPREPRAGERTEVIVTIREQETGFPFRGYLTFEVASPAGEAGQMLPLPFGAGQFESTHVFRHPGVYGLSVVFNAEAADHRVGPIPVTVRPASRLAARAALTLTLVTAATYAAAFRRSRRRPPAGGRHE